MEKSLTSIEKVHQRALQNDSPAHRTEKQMILRACLYKPTTTTTATTVTTASSTAKMKTSIPKRTNEAGIEDGKADAFDEVVMEPVVSNAASYPNLVST